MTQIDSLLNAPLRLSALKGALNAAVVPFHVALYGAVGDGVTDDSAAILAAFSDWAATGGPGTLAFDNKAYFISQPIVVQIAAHQGFRIEGSGARLVASANFSGTLLHITEMPTSSATAESLLPTVTVKDISFISTWGTQAQNTALRIETQNTSTGQLGPSVDLHNIRIQTDNPSGDWAFGIDLFGMNVTRTRSVYMHGSTGSTSVCLRIDTDSRISVGHTIDDVTVLGGGTGIALGHPGATGPLQGINVTNFNPLCTNGIVWRASTDADELIVSNSNLSCSGVGIWSESVTSVIVTGSYFLGCGTAIQFTKSTAAGSSPSVRHAIVGNIFYAGVPVVPAVPNYCITLNNVMGGPAGGVTITGNTFTNLYGPTTGSANASPIQISGASDYMTISGNDCVGQVLVNDTSGSGNNRIGGNFEGGLANAMYFRAAPAFDNGIILSGYPLATNLWGSLKNVAGNVKLAGTNVVVGQSGGGLGFFDNGTLGTQKSVTGSVGSSTAATLKSLISALAAYGLVIDSTTS